MEDLAYHNKKIKVDWRNFSEPLDYSKQGEDMKEEGKTGEKPVRRLLQQFGQVMMSA
jgi:hypothetical protein